MSSSNRVYKSFPAVAAFAFVTCSAAVRADSAAIEIGPTQVNVNVMQKAMPKIPAYTKLALKPGYVRGFVKDSAGKPLAGAVIGVRSSAVGGYYSGAQGKSDTRGYYEVKVPWGAAHFYCAGYTVDYGDGRAALGLHPADGETGSFPSNKGHIENWVLLNYGIADRDEASEKPAYAGVYYGGTFYLDYSVADSRPLFADDYSLPVGSTVEFSLTPNGKLMDGSAGRAFTFRKRISEDGYNNIRINNVPVGTYRFNARLLEDGKASPLRIVETGPNASQPFGLQPKDARGQTLLTFRPGGAKAGMAVAQHGNWDSLAIALKR